VEADRLRAVNLTVNDRKECNQKSSWNGEIRIGMFCAGSFEGGSGPCVADSGGAFVCNSTLAGVISFVKTLKCVDPKFPAAFVDVDYYKDWIAIGGSPKTAANFAIILATFITKFIF